MAAKKSRSKTPVTEPAAAPHTEGYEQALGEFARGLELTHAGEYKEALELFQKISSGNPDEPELTERARAYASVCNRKLATEPEAPTTAEGLYLLGVIRSNDGRLDEALDLLNRGLAMEPGSARLHYARASAYALKGQADAAVADLRSAVEGDPKLRFQAGNDPDFERIRDEASFIDVIEPTPTGA
jgi:tetratricopeptide (TPR) repeat protein